MEQKNESIINLTCMWSTDFGKDQFLTKAIQWIETVFYTGCWKWIFVCKNLKHLSMDHRPKFKTELYNP